MSISGEDENGGTKSTEQLDAFKTPLEQDPFMEISIGNGNIPLRVPTSTLVSISGYFVSAAKHQNLRSGQAGTLSFPEDNVDAWILLLCWKKEKALPTRSGSMSDSEITACLRAWILGDKYGVVDFQNLVMLQLLHHFKDQYLNLQDAEFTFHSTLPHSPLRRLMAEEIAHAIHEKKISPTSLKPLDGATGATSDMAVALAGYDRTVTVTTSSAKRLRQRWTEFMVGDGSYPSHEPTEGYLEDPDDCDDW